MSDPFGFVATFWSKRDPKLNLSVKIPCDVSLITVITHQQCRVSQSQGLSDRHQQP